MATLRVTLPIRASIVVVDGVDVAGRGTAAKELDACADCYRTTFAEQGITAPGSVPGVEVGRELFHALGIDPTRHRPCSEALLNRALKGKPQPHRFDLVDVGNWCALDFLLPLGVYDADAIAGDIVLRQGKPGETYRAINDRDITLEGRYLLADERAAFGSPITDSKRTAVTEATRRTVIVMYAPESYPADRLQVESAQLGDRVVDCCGGTVASATVVSGVHRD